MGTQVPKWGLIWEQWKRWYLESKMKVIKKRLFLNILNLEDRRPGFGFNCQLNRVWQESQVGSAPTLFLRWSDWMFFLQDKQNNNGCPADLQPRHGARNRDRGRPTPSIIGTRLTACFARPTKATVNQLDQVVQQPTLGKEVDRSHFWQQLYLEDSTWRHRNPARGRKLSIPVLELHT